MTDMDKMLDERQKTHGAFRDHAYCTQRLKAELNECLIARQIRKQPSLSHQQRESLEMILHKIGRIVAGNPNENDHWDDIAGYAKIANKVYIDGQRVSTTDELEGTQGAVPTPSRTVTSKGGVRG